ncbi:hypothetical protein ACS5LO_000219 [Citrobacter koseri]
MTTITREQAKDLRNAFECWQQDYDPTEDKEQYEMFGLGVVAMDVLLASLDAGSDSHPAHGPLSNNRLHRISDILRKAAAQSDGGNIGYAMSDAVKAIDELLEVRTAEPDYIRYDCGCCGWETIEDWRDNDVCPKCNHKPMCKTELFTTPPAPVEPLTDEQIDDVLDSRGNILYVIADKRERLRMFAREILRAAMGDKS